MKLKMSFLLLVISLAFLVACAPNSKEKSIEDIDIKEIHKDVKKELGEDYLANMSMGLDELSKRTGVDKDAVDEFIADFPLINVHVDTFIAIKAKKDKAYQVAQTLLDYKKYLDKEAFQYPTNFAKVKAAKVVRKGDYVFFIMIGKPNDIDNQESEEALKFSQGQVKRVENIIDEACG